ncbi:uncharacterized protein LOC111126422 [Crassostrea virginica]
MKISVVLVACLISMALGMSTTRHHGHHHTHPTHATHEPSINEVLSFHYDAHSSTLAVKTHRHCYLYTMTADEQTAVHTSTGLHAIEKTVIDLIDANSATTAVAAHDLMTMSHGLSHFCGKLTAMKLN